jgi:hypothetical protein
MAYFDPQGNPARDYPLTFRWRSPELADSLGFPRAPNANYKLVIDTMLAELTLAAEAGKPLSYSRRWEFYKRSRYRHQAFTYTNVMRAVDVIVNHGVGIENRT